MIDEEALFAKIMELQENYGLGKITYEKFKTEKTLLILEALVAEGQDIDKYLEEEDDV